LPSRPNNGSDHHAIADTNVTSTISVTFKHTGFTDAAIAAKVIHNSTRRDRQTPGPIDVDPPRRPTVPLEIASQDRNQKINRAGASNIRFDPPYLLSEVKLLQNWACALPTKPMREGAHALLCLGLGVPLAPNEIIEVKPEHVNIADDGTVTVDVFGNNPRSVTCRREWEQELASAARKPEIDYIFLPGKRRNRSLVTNFIARTAPDNPTLKITATRLRDTWIVGQITAGAPEYSIRTTAAVSASRLERLRLFAPASATWQTEQQLRGPAE
jgi:hypothetical protein